MRFLSFLLLGSVLACGGSGGGGSTNLICEGLECDATVNLDADGDGLISICDSNDTDPLIITILAACDADGDSHADVSCSSYDSDGDDVLIYSEYQAAGAFCDNCIGVANSAQGDSDGDGTGDSCDCSPYGNDDDGDCYSDSVDNCPAAYNYDQADSDSDGTGDSCDTDIDGDGVLDETDNCTGFANASQVDTDSDGIGDYCDTDRDGDGVADATDYTGTAIEGGTDTCPTQAQNESLAVDGTDTHSWNGCAYDTDGDGITDDDEASGCLYDVSSSCGSE